MRYKCHFSWQVQYLVTFKCHFSWQVHYLVKFKCHFSWQAGAAFREIWNDPERETLYFAIENARGEHESNLGCEPGCGLTVLWSDHGRILLGSAPHSQRLQPSTFASKSDIGKRFWYQKRF